MQIAVRYVSRSGNTKKLADAIALAAGCQAKPAADALNGKTDLLFVGGAIYAGGIDKKLEDFLQSLSADNVQKVAVFGTAAGGKSIQPQVKSILAGKNILVSEEVFQCRGKFLLANRKKPDQEDLDNAKKFAEKIIAAK